LRPITVPELSTAPGRWYGAQSCTQVLFNMQSCASSPPAILAERYSYPYIYICSFYFLVKHVKLVSISRFIFFNTDPFYSLFFDLYVLLF
jgi:hypothetical protein